LARRGSHPGLESSQPAVGVKLLFSSASSTTGSNAEQSHTMTLSEISLIWAEFSETKEAFQQPLLIKMGPYR
jgi:hypothetical protein